MTSKCNRPNKDSHGHIIESNDRVFIKFRGVKVLAIIDDQIEGKIRPLRNVDTENVAKLIGENWYFHFGTNDQIMRIDPDEEIDEGGIEWGG